MVLTSHSRLKIGSAGATSVTGPPRNGRGEITGETGRRSPMSLVHDRRLGLKRVGFESYNRHLRGQRFQKSSLYGVVDGLGFVGTVRQGLLGTPRMPVGQRAGPGGPGRVPRNVEARRIHDG